MRCWAFGAAPLINNAVQSKAKMLMTACRLQAPLRMQRKFKKIKIHKLNFITLKLKLSSYIPRYTFTEPQ